jgi:hypothetical protein
LCRERKSHGSDIWDPDKSNHSEEGNRFPQTDQLVLQSVRAASAIEEVATGTRDEERVRTYLLRMERKVLSLEDSSLFILSRPLGSREGDSAPTSVMVDVEGRKGRKTTSRIGTQEKAY